MPKLRLATALLLTVFLGEIGVGSSAVGQDSQLLLRDAGIREPSLENSSFTFVKPVPAPLPQELEKNSIITVLVDYRTRIFSEGDYENRKNANLIARLADWLWFDGKSIRPAPQRSGDPTISGALISQYRAEADMESRDSIAFSMATRVVDIRPNGNLVLEGHQTIRNNEEQWQLSLTGVVERTAIAPDRTVSSRSIASLHVVKKEMGHVRDGYNRGWLQKTYDKLKPF